MYIFCNVHFTLGCPAFCSITAPVAYMIQRLEGNLDVFTHAFLPAKPSQVWKAGRSEQ